MNSKIVILLSFCFMVCALASPQWPTAFQTRFDEVHSNRVLVGQWLYNSDLSSTRKDYVDSSSNARVVELSNYQKGKQWTISQAPNGTITCDVHQLTTEIYDFSKFTLVGQTSTRGKTCNTWLRVIGEVTVVYTVSLDGEPMELSHQIHGKEETIHFYEYAEVAPEASSFDLALIDEHKVCKDAGRNTIDSLPSNVAPMLVTLPRSVCDKAASLAEGKASCGCPYVWGGNECGCHGSGGLDCSGLTSWSYRNAGWGSIARTASAQAAQGGGAGSCRPDNVGACIPGDLFFFNFGGGGIEHVVMYIGGNRIAECPEPGQDCHVVAPYMEAFVEARRYC